MGRRWLALDLAACKDKVTEQLESWASQRLSSPLAISLLHMEHPILAVQRRRTNLTLCPRQGVGNAAGPVPLGVAVAQGGLLMHL